MEGEPKQNIIASFSQDASKFAFQANLPQKNGIDIYPLDPTTGYKINSSFVSCVDYESTEFHASDLLFLNWCKSTDTPNIGSRQSKRKPVEDNASENKDNDKRELKTENFFVNAFPKGQLVIYSSNGKDIVNIIRNRQEIIGLDTVDNNIWVLDSNKVVKIFDYKSNKPLKIFTLIDEKNEDITNFQVFKIIENEILIIIFTENNVYVIDPGKRRPSTKAKFEIFGGICGGISFDGQYIVIANIDNLYVYDIQNQELIKSWSLQVEDIKIFNNNYIFALTTKGQFLNVYQINQDDAISSIKVANSEILDFTRVRDDMNNSNILIAWLNVNEPNFELFTLDTIISNKELIINKESVELDTINDHRKINEEGKKDMEDSKSKKVDKSKEEEEPKADANVNETKDNKKNENKQRKKITKKEQNSVVSQLISLIESRGSESEVINNLTSANTWNDARVSWFISNYITSESIATFLFKCITNELQRRIHEETTLLNTWLKWLLTLINIPNSFKHDKVNKKTLKHFKSSLKTSSESLPILLGIQGKLEMLIRQAKLREELYNLPIEEASTTSVPDNTVIEEDEGQNGDESENINYVNGETDIFVDAQE